MSVIKRDNYEQFFIDYLDGVLTPSEKNQLMAFLIANPDLKEELEELKNTQIRPDNNSFNKKSALKRTPVISLNQDTNFDELCIARIEGDLNISSINEFDSLIEENADFKTQFSLFEKTILHPEPAIVFQKKSQLKKSVFIRSLKTVYFQYLSVAASIALLFALTFLMPKSFQKDQKNNYELVSSNHDNKELTNIKTIASSATQKEKPIVQHTKKVFVAEVEHQINSNVPSENFDSEKLEILHPLKSRSILLAHNETIVPEIKISDPLQSSNDYLLADAEIKPRSIKEILVHSFNKNILKKESDLDKIQSWDFAQLAITGVNKVTGSNMSLNKKYDSNGTLEELEFNSKLIAFSTPVKK